jgi:hypothetical protein
MSKAHQNGNINAFGSSHRHISIRYGLSGWNHLEPPTELVGQFAEMLRFPQRHNLGELPRQIVEEVQDGFFPSRAEHPNIIVGNCVTAEAAAG